MSNCGLQVLNAAAGLSHRWLLCLDYAIPSQIRAASNHRFSRACSTPNDELRGRLRALRLSFAIPEAAEVRKVIVTRLWGKGKRPYARANLVSRSEMLLDALARSGWLVDNGPMWVRDQYHQQRNPDGDHCATQIEVAVFAEGITKGGAVDR